MSSSDLMISDFSGVLDVDEEADADIDEAGEAGAEEAGEEPAEAVLGGIFSWPWMPFISMTTTILVALVLKLVPCKK